MFRSEALGASNYSGSAFLTMVWVCAPAVAIIGNYRLPVTG